VYAKVEKAVNNTEYLPVSINPKTPETLKKTMKRMIQYNGHDMNQSHGLRILEKSDVSMNKSHRDSYVK